MTLRRYLLVRTGWAAGVLFAFVSIAYVGIWVAGDFGHQPGYAGFLWGALRGSQGHAAATQPPSEPLSVSSLVWHAAPVTLSLLLVTAVFTLLVAVSIALLARRGRRARGSVRAFEFLGVSLLPLWTGLMIQGHLVADHHLLHAAGYCPLVSAPAGQCPRRRRTSPAECGEASLASAGAGRSCVALGPKARPLYRRSGDPKRMLPSGSIWEPSRLPYS